MAQIGSNGPNRTEVGKSELNITNMNGIGPKRTKVVRIDRIVPK